MGGDPPGTLESLRALGSIPGDIATTKCRIVGIR
jgi:hypothetical protein